MNGVQLIAKERNRQVTEEDWSAKHDDTHDEGELARAAAAYAIDAIDYRSDESTRYHVFRAAVKLLWPWSVADWSPTPKNRVRQLVKAGALIAAEIDRLQRAKSYARNKSG